METDSLYIVFLLSIRGLSETIDLNSCFCLRFLFVAKMITRAMAITTTIAVTLIMIIAVFEMPADGTNCVFLVGQGDLVGGHGDGSVGQVGFVAFGDGQGCESVGVVASGRL